MTVWFRVPDTDSDPRPDPRGLVPQGYGFGASGQRWVTLFAVFANFEVEFGRKGLKKRKNV
jgi:hypothetical protein